MKLLTKNQNGFTLIELLIALVIFAVGILGVGAMQLTSIKGNSKGRLISEASNLAANRIEILMSFKYSALTDTDGDGTSGLDDMTTATVDGKVDSDGDGVNDIFWNVAVDHPEPGTKTIKVFVDPPGNRTGLVEMSFIKSSIF